MSKACTAVYVFLVGATLVAKPNAFQLTNGSTVSVFSTSSFQETGVVGCPNGAVARLVVSPDGSNLYLAGGTPVRASVATGLIAQTYNLTYPSWPPQIGPMAVSPDGKSLYVSTFWDYPEVIFVNAASGQVTATVVDNAESERWTPRTLLVTPDGKTLILVNSPAQRYGNGAVAVIDIATQKVRNLRASAPLWGPAVLTPDGRRLYAIAGQPTPSEIVELDLQTGSTLATIAAEFVNDFETPARIN
jgi:hypothetical protein